LHSLKDSLLQKVKKTKFEGLRLMKKSILVLVALMVVGISQVAAQNASTDFSRNADFSHYKTYQWVPVKSAEQLDSLTAEQLIGTLDVELAKKGLTKSKSDTADLYIGYQIADAKTALINQYAIGSTYSVPPERNSAATVHTGQLTLLMYDVGNKQLVWRSTVANAIDANAKPDKKQRHMDSGVEKLLRNYPPQKK
jgi:hypothetical protein